MELEQKLKTIIRDVPDFPKPGILFKDITPLMADPGLCQQMVSQIITDFKGKKIDGIAGIESRGFLLGMPLAMALNVPFILVRKKGKLPYKTISHAYELEYGTAEIEMHVDSIQPGQQILIHDDLLATGGSASAAAELILKQNGKIAGFSFLVDLSFLNGQNRIKNYSENISTLVRF
ncbi:MAG: adenine phosphoribosyltransferase [Crocinitomicaceae bacterium]|nr:adenine phosphoribosyltransferase [Crocinitomicaceae bacterium]MBK8926284.1 adenine phosphoribosyltransferase [Crocinitomicaceae bacterium]